MENKKRIYTLEEKSLEVIKQELRNQGKKANNQTAANYAVMAYADYIIKNEEEEWREVKGYEGHYIVSSYGNVKTLKFGKEKFMTKCNEGKGYSSLVLSNKDKVKSTQYVHKLVAIAFLNHKPSGLDIVVDHIDNDKQNNRADNLQLISHRENCSKDKKNGTSKYTGVSWCKGRNKWRTMINIDRKSKFLGYFTNELEAAEAYQTELKQIKNK